MPAASMKQKVREMGEAKRTEIKCAGCGKKIPVTTGEGHTAIAKCDCGATTYVEGEPGPVLKELNELLTKVPALLQNFKDTRRKGFETGLDEALHDTSREIAFEILREDQSLRKRFKELVRGVLEDSIPEREGDLPRQ
jgi:hypothetical protein